MSTEIERFAQAFPNLKQTVYHKRLAYLDNAATTLKPHSMTEAIKNYYDSECATVHRGVYFFSAKHTQTMEECRELTAKYIGAKQASEIIFTSGTSDSINKLSNMLEKFIFPGDEICTTILEHHSNFLPWQQLAKNRDAHFKVLPVNEQGDLMVSEDDFHIKTKIFAITGLSNAIGTLTPLRDIIQMVRNKSPHCLIVVDAAQLVSHSMINVSELDADFCAFSVHKMFGPTGLGILYGKLSLLNQCSSPAVGGGMIEYATINTFKALPAPMGFEVGTPNISAIIGFKHTLEFLMEFDWKILEQHEQSLHSELKYKLSKLPGITFVGNPKDQRGVISFTFGQIHPHDIGSLLDREGIAVRVGHHCAYPLMQFFKIPATVRVSLAPYNQSQDIDQLIAGLKQVYHIFDYTESQSIRHE